MELCTKYRNNHFALINLHKNPLLYIWNIDKTFDYAARVRLLYYIHIIVNLQKFQSKFYTNEKKYTNNNRFYIEIFFLNPFLDTYYTFIGIVIIVMC